MPTSNPGTSPKETRMLTEEENNSAVPTTPIDGEEHPLVGEEVITEEKDKPTTVTLEKKINIDDFCEHKHVFPKPNFNVWDGLQEAEGPEHKEALKQWYLLTEGDEKIYVLMHMALLGAGRKLNEEKKWTQKEIEGLLKKIDANIKFEAIRDFLKIDWSGKYTLCFVRKIVNYLAFSYCIEVLQKGNDQQKADVRKFIRENGSANERFEIKEITNKTETDLTLPTIVLPKSLALIDKNLYDAWKQLKQDEITQVLAEIFSYYQKGYNKNKGMGYEFTGKENEFFPKVILKEEWRDFLMAIYTTALFKENALLQQKRDVLEYMASNPTELFLKLDLELIDSTTNKEFSILTNNLNGVLNLTGNEKIKISPSVKDFSTRIEDVPDRIWISADKKLWEKISKGIESEHLGGNVFSISLDDCVRLKKNLMLVIPILNDINSLIHKKESLGFLSRKIWGGYEKEMKILKEFRDYYLLDKLFDKDYSIENRLKDFTNLRRNKWEKEGLSNEGLHFLEVCTGKKVDFVLHTKTTKVAVNTDPSEIEPLLTKKEPSIVPKKWGPITVVPMDLSEKGLTKQLSDISKLDPELQTALIYLAFHLGFVNAKETEAELKRLLVAIDNVANIHEIPFLVQDTKTKEYALAMPKNLANLLLVFYLIERANHLKEDTALREEFSCLRYLLPAEMISCKVFIDKLIENGALKKEHLSVAHFNKEMQLKEIENALEKFFNTKESYNFSFVELEELSKKFKIPRDFMDKYLYEGYMALLVKNKDEHIHFNREIKELLATSIVVHYDVEGNTKILEARKKLIYDMYIVRREEKDISLTSCEGSPMFLQYKDENGNNKLKLCTRNSQNIAQLIEVPEELLKHFYDFDFTSKPTVISGDKVAPEVHLFIQKQLKEVARPYLVIPTSIKKMNCLFQNLESMKSLFKIIEEEIKNSSVSTCKPCCFFSSDDADIKKVKLSLLPQFKKFLWNKILEQTKEDNAIKVSEELLNDFIKSVSGYTSEQKYRAYGILIGSLEPALKTEPPKEEKKVTV